MSFVCQSEPFVLISAGHVTACVHAQADIPFGNVHIEHLMDDIFD